MRKTGWLLLGALLLGGCSDDATAPEDAQASLVEMETLAAAVQMAGAMDGGRHLARLPDGLKLSDEQVAALRALTAEQRASGCYRRG